MLLCVILSQRHLTLPRLYGYFQDEKSFYLLLEYAKVITRTVALAFILISSTMPRHSLTLVLALTQKITRILAVAFVLL